MSIQYKRTTIKQAYGFILTPCWSTGVVRKLGKQWAAHVTYKRRIAYGTTRDAAVRAATSHGI